MNATTATSGYRALLGALFLIGFAGMLSLFTSTVLIGELTRSPLWVGAIGTADFGALLLASGYGRRLLWRWPPMRIYVTVLAMHALWALVLALLDGVGALGPWLLLGGAAGQGAIHGLLAASEWAIMRAFAGDDGVGRLVGDCMTVLGVARLAGPIVCGLLVEHVDGSVLFAIVSLGFAGACALLGTRVRVSVAPAVGVRPSSGRWRLVAARRSLLLGLLSILALAQVAAPAVVPYVVNRMLGGSPSDFAAASTVVALGALIGGIAWARFTRRGAVSKRVSHGIIAGSALCVGASLLGLALWPQVAPAQLLFVLGAMRVLCIAGLATALHEGLSQSESVEVNSVEMQVSLFSNASGQLAVGALADLAGVTVALLYGAAAATIAAILQPLRR